MSEEHPTVEYRTLPEYDGYRFGDDGSAWSFWKQKGLGRFNGSVRLKTATWVQLKGNQNTSGYLHVSLRTIANVYKIRMLHQLILLAFGFQKPSKTHQVCHANRNKKDNRLCNVRWGTPKENAQDAIRHGTHSSLRTKKCK